MMTARRRPAFSGTIWCIAWIAIVGGVVCAQPPADKPDDKTLSKPPELSGQGGSIPARVIDGRLVISCDISGTRLRVPINLWLDFDGAYGLQLHNRAAANLPAETPDGRPSPLTLHFPDFTIKLARRELGPEEAFEKFTKYHSKQLGENALVGAIGSHILKHFDVVFDLPRGQVNILPPGGLAEGAGSSVEGAVVTPITIHNDLIWLPVNMDSSKGKLKKALAIASSRYDTLLDERLCNSLRKPAGNIGPLRCESIDFAPYVAFRPAEVVQVHPDGVAGVMGINLLENFRIHIDRQSLLVTLLGVGSASYPKEEFAFFQAMVAEDPTMVLEWLTKHSKTRLGREAAELLLTLLLDEGAEESELEKAVQWVNDTMSKDLRATRMFDLLEELVNEGEKALGVSAGQLGLKSARADRYPESNYKLHGRLGELLLKDDRRQAWKHLLSAAFGLPEDGMINLNLGRVYEADGKSKRAFSRYIQALIKEESSELAMESLVRLDAQLPAEERMTIETIDRMISGRVRNYSAPTKFERDDDTKTNRTAVVEFFTNAYVGDERAGAIGGALGNQGAISHFEPKDCVFLSYHLPVPKSEPLVTPLAMHMQKWLGVRNPTVQVINGTTPAPGAGRNRHGERIFEATRKAVVSSLRSDSSFAIKATGKVTDDGTVAGSVTIKGPAEPDKYVVQVVIAERGVVFHGSSGVVIHRMLARGLATYGSLGGEPYTPKDDGTYKLDFSRSLDELVFSNENFLFQQEKGKQQTNKTVRRMGLRIEPKSVEVVVLVREARTGRVMQAAKCDLGRTEKAK